MKMPKYAGTIPAIALVFSAGAANAGTVSPDIIFGSGNANGGFTVTDTTLNFPSSPFSGSLELGLRAKLRYDSSGAPQNQFNYDGVDTYSFNLADGNPPANRAMWNFEWAVNTQGITDSRIGGSAEISLASANDYNLILSFDTDPTAGTAFSSYNVILDGDGWYGTNATANGGGTYVNTFDTNSANDVIPAGSTVAQNSVNYGFIPGAPLGAGLFDIKLSAFSLSNVEFA
jgi:hypothetical protein